MYYRKRRHNNDWDVISLNANADDDASMIQVDLPFTTSGYSAHVESGCLSTFIDPVVVVPGGDITDTTPEAFRSLKVHTERNKLMLQYGILFEKGLSFISAGNENMYLYFDGTVQNPTNLFNETEANWKYCVSPYNSSSATDTGPSTTIASTTGYQSQPDSTIVLVTLWMPLTGLSYDRSRLVEELRTVFVHIGTYMYNRLPSGYRSASALTWLRSHMLFTNNVSTKTVSVQVSKYDIVQSNERWRYWLPTLPSVSAKMGDILGLPSLPLQHNGSTFAFTAGNTLTGISDAPIPTVYYIFCVEGRHNCSTHGVHKSLVCTVVPNTDGTFNVAPHDRVYFQPIKHTSSLTFQVVRADGRTISDHSLVRRLHIRLVPL